MTWSEDENWEEEQSRSPCNVYTPDIVYTSDEEDTEISPEEYTSEPPLKRLKTCDFDDVNDKISTLPDSVLHHILSFRDMGEVIRTSEISRRWRSLWKSVPSLNLEFVSKFPYNRRVAVIVERILLLRNRDADIDKLCLSCDLRDGDLRNWIKLAERRKLRELSLSVPLGARIKKIPQSIFTSDKIEVVTLCSNHCDHLQLPKSMCSAPHLKTIELNSIKLPERNQKKELIISCLVLEELKIIDCDHHNIRVLHISVPQLKSLVVKNQYSDYNDSCEIRIFTPSIESLVLKGTTYSSYSFGDLISLVNATFSIYNKSATPAILYQVLQGLNNVRNLKLTGYSVDSSEEDTDLVDQIFNPFLNLRCLQITGFRDCSDVGVFQNLLTNAPSIENLILGIDQLGLDKDLAVLFKCVSRLKSIEIERIEGRETELKFMEFVLGNAIVLEDFTWTCNNSYYQKTRKDRAYFNTQLHSLPRANPSVQLLFDA